MESFMLVTKALSSIYLLSSTAKHVLSFSPFLPQTPNTKKQFPIRNKQIRFMTTNNEGDSSSTDIPFFGDTQAAGSCINITFDSKDEGVAPKYALGYWSIRGLGAPLTMMMCAAKVPFSLFLYDISEDDEQNGGGGWKSGYFQAKGGYIQQYDAPLWNLPFCVDRENKKVVCQTNAVFASLGRVCGMYGSDETATSQCEQLLCEIYDLRDIMVRYSYGGNDSPEKTLDMANGKFKKLEAWLELEAKRTNAGDKRVDPGDSPKANVIHLVEGKLSAPDFHLYEMLDQFEEFAKYYKLGNFLDGFGRLKAFKEGFSSLEENRFYLESWLHTELPFNNCMAQFGSLPGPAVYTYGESASSATWRGKGVISMSPSSTS